MKKISLSAIFLLATKIAFTQGIHFSQINNAPMLINPANTGMIQDNEWRTGINYRTQAVTVPVPYNTFSIFADGGINRNKWETNWIGAGLAVWRDVAGNGNLALTKIQGNVAYHTLTSDNTSFSGGLGVAYNQRSVDFSKLTYDVQWDEYSFNSNLPNNETNTTQKTQFLDLSAGVNFAYYNNTNFYVKISAAARNINQPKESFYGSENKLGLRPIANIDITYKVGNRLMVNPSFYYTRQKKASEIVSGAMFNINVGENRNAGFNEFLIGAYYRNNDAVIISSGYKFRQHCITFSYDHTVSDLSQGNGGFGAFELSLILQGNYKPANDIAVSMGCPRF